MARGRRKSSKAEIGLIIGILTVLWLLFSKTVEFVFKILQMLIQYVSDDINWTKQKIKQYNGNWSALYEAELYVKTDKYIAVIFCLLGIIFCFHRTWVGLIFGLGSIFSMFFPRSISKRISKKFKEIVLLVCSVLGLVFNLYYISIENAEINELTIKNELNKEKEKLFKRHQKAKSDSSNIILKLGKQALSKRKYPESIELFNNALRIYPDNDASLFHLGLALKESKKIDDALMVFASIKPNSTNYQDGLINQSLCLLKKGKEERAIYLLKKASDLNNVQAVKLYNKYNPIKKRIIGYITRCCDGEISGSKGQGACSHHDGVCNWNEPIYNEYRKYP